MSTKEKNVWLAVALALALYLLALHTLVPFVPGADVAGWRQVFTHATGWLTGLYLMILSWRAAYIAGRKS